MAKTKWTREKYDELVKDIKSDIESEGLEDGLYDIADSLLSDEPGLKEFIIKELGASDYKGRLAGDIG